MPGLDRDAGADQARLSPGKPLNFTWLVPEPQWNAIITSR